MGYYTSYGLDIECKPEHIEKQEAFEKEFLELANKYNYGEEVRDLIKYGRVYTKGYVFSDWITSLAPKYPELLITLEGNGDDNGDWWEERWRGKEHEIRAAIIPPFTNKNPSSL